MSSNQRRSGFRLPWISDEEQAEQAASTEPKADASGQTGPASTAASTNGGSATGGSEQSAASPSGPSAPSAPPATESAPVAPTPAAATAPASATPVSPVTHASAEPPNEFLRELIAAMRGVADEARDSGVMKLRAAAEGAVRALEAEAERRRADLRQRAEADVAGVGEWARAEAERIRAEAEQRVAARRARLEEQLAAEGTRTEAQANALRKRVDDYERELEAFHAQLSEITDPAAFAAAAKRMPAPPELTPVTAPVETAPPPADAAGLAASVNGTSASSADPAAAGAGPTSSSQPPTAVHPDEEVVLSVPANPNEQYAGGPVPVAAGGPMAADDPATDGGAPPLSGRDDSAGSYGAATEIVVKGLGSFGAITGFRQTLSTQPGIGTVALSLGEAGEFVFRATHAPGFDVTGAIKAMEGDNATIEPRAEGGLRVTLDRPR